jgi:SAM-dependent methyltransferase
MTTETAGPQDVKEAIRDQWSHAAGVWGKWHAQFSRMTGDVTRKLCDAAALKPGMDVLDLAGGTGEPAITAAQRVAPGGTVTYSDFAPPMIEVAQKNAREAGVSNINFKQVDAEDIPFDDASFDAVVSRFGIMFPPDTQKALGEIKRVLKPGGGATFVVWQLPAKNPWFEEMNAVLAKHGLLTPPPPNMPGPFRFGEPGSLPTELRKAGFQDVVEKALHPDWAWYGPPEEYLDFMQGTLPPVRKALETPGAQTDEIRRDLLAVLAAHDAGGRLVFDSNVFVVTGVAG